MNSFRNYCLTNSVVSVCLKEPSILLFPNECPDTRGGMILKESYELVVLWTEFRITKICNGNILKG